MARHRRKNKNERRIGSDACDAILNKIQCDTKIELLLSVLRKLVKTIAINVSNKYGINSKNKPKCYSRSLYIRNNSKLLLIKQK